MSGALVRGEPGDPANGVGVEHVIWAAAAGLTPGDVLTGFKLPYPLNVGADWDFVRRSLACRWRRLPVAQGNGE